MKIIPFSELHKVDFTLSEILAFPQFWRDGSAYCFARQGRPDNGLMFLTAVSAAFTEGELPCTEAFPSDIIYLPRGSHYRVVFSGTQDKTHISNHLINFIIKDADGEEISLSDSVTAYRVKDSDVYGERFARITAKSMTAFYPPCKVKAAVYTLLCDISQSLQSSEATQSSLPILPAAEYISSNYMSPDITVAKLAEMSCMSESNFRRVFTKSMGMPPKEYILKLKLGKAELLLTQCGYTVEEAAHYVGFDDVSYFVRIYKKHMNISPGKEKNKLWQ